MKQEEILSKEEKDDSPSILLSNVATAEGVEPTAESVEELSGR